jgi:hypothetical protein
MRQPVSWNWATTRRGREQQPRGREKRRETNMAAGMRRSGMTWFQER